eukprot:604519-Pyramimonas_sp.AAC.1
MVDYDDFTNCEAHRRRGAHAAVTLDQDECIDALTPVWRADLVDLEAGEPVGGPFPDCFVSFLGPLTRCSRNVALPSA